MSLDTRGYSLQKPGPDHFGTNHSCPVDAHGSNGEKYTGDLKSQDAYGIGHGTQTKRSLLDPASMNPEQLTSKPTKQDLLSEEIQKLATKTHLEVPQRQDIRQDLAERMKFVLPDFRAGEQEDPSKIQQGRKSGKVVEGGNHCSQGPHGRCQYRCDHTSGKHKQAETVGHWIWQNFWTRVSEKERLCCDSLVKVKQMSGKCSLTILI